MLAKEIKIKTMKKQREFIKKQLSLAGNSKDGDPCYKYVGHVCPENIAYFENEGYKVTCLDYDAVIAETKGYPIYVFIVGDIELTEDELEAAESKLAKEIKIKTMKKQREFIEEKLSEMGKRDDGDSCYRYLGQLYPENIAYFENEGYKVTHVECDALIAQTQGLPVYLFAVGDIELTEDELKEAESIDIGEESNCPCGGIIVSVCE